MGAPFASKTAEGAAVVAALVAVAIHCGSLDPNGSSGGGSSCSPGDMDGVANIPAAFDLSVNDTNFYTGDAGGDATTVVLTAQNRSPVTLTMKNTGTRPHDLVVGCLPTPNANGCPAQSCFPDAAAISAIAPDASATIRFVTPSPEGLYTFRSNLPGDTQTGQFNVN
jgi:hypothetical protein